MFAWRDGINARVWDNRDLVENQKWVANERMWLLVETPKEKWAIGSVYIATDGKKNEHWNDIMYEVLTEEVTKLKNAYKILLMGDFNGRIGSDRLGIQDGDPVRNGNGERLLKFSKRTGFDILNREASKCEGKWTRQWRNQQSIIDYVLTESRAKKQVNRMKIWDNGQRDIGSDHNWISVSVELKEGLSGRAHTKKRKGNAKWDISEKTDWNCFTRKCSEVFSVEFIEGLDEGGLEEAYNKILEGLKGVAESTVGVKKPRRGRKMIPKNVKDAIKERKEARVGINRCEERDKQQFWDIYMEKKKEADRLKAQYRNAMNKKTCERICNAGKNSSRQFWQEIRKNNYKQELEEIDIGGRIERDEEVILEETRKYFSELGKAPAEETDNDALWDDRDMREIAMKADHPYAEKERQGDGKLIQREHNYSRKRVQNESEVSKEVFLGKEFNEEEVEIAVRKLKKGKACGLDEIPSEFIIYGGAGLNKALLKIFNRVRKGGVAPGGWNIGKIKLIHKGGVKNKLDNYRGITISSCIGKVYCSVLKERLEKVVEEEGTLGEIQTGFRKNRCGMDNVLVLRQIWDRAKGGNDKLYLAFVDLRKAYDRVWRKGLWRCLDELALGKQFIDMIRCLYVNVTSKVEVKGARSNEIRSEIGLKQGCILSPILFALYISRVGSRLGEKGLGVVVGKVKVPAMFFADDMVLMANKQGDMDYLLDVLGRTLACKKLEINCNKSEIMVRLGRKREEGEWVVHDNKGVEIGKIKEVDKYKYLGLLISRKSRNPFAEHLTKVLSKARSMGGAIRAKALHSWDRVEVADKLWNSMAVPGILYGAEVIQYNNEIIDKLEVVQNEMARWILGARRFCAVAAARAELGWESIRSQIYACKLRYWGRICFYEEERWAKMAVKECGRESKWLEEIETIRKTVGLGDMLGCHSRQQWNTRVKCRISEWERARASEDMGSKVSLRWYPCEAWQKGRRQGYVNGSDAAKLFFQVKTGCMVLKKKGKDFVKCCVCEEEVDSEIHRILRCKGTDGWRRDSGIGEIVEEIRNGVGITPDRDVEVMRALVRCGKEEALKRGNMFKDLEKLFKVE